MENARQGRREHPGGLTRIDGVLNAVPTSTDVLLLMEGTNDISQRASSFETTRFNLNQMARKAENRGSR